MATITTIKEKILSLDAGSFQILCDSYLSREGYPNIVALGTHAGTQKTTRGTPDTYFRLSNGKYVFVEYTTQRDRLVEKIREDIRKCLNKNLTEIELEDVVEIIYCHTSSNIAPKYDKEFRELCNKHGIAFTIIGIDRLAEDLFLKYQSLVKKHLSIAIDTEQIQTVEEFIKNYDANALSAPLNIPFLFRENDIIKIQKAYENVDAVILSGPAGVGKTKLAMQYAEKYTKERYDFVYCIRDRALPIFDDLCMYLESQGWYFIVVDDANQLSSLELIVEYVNKKSQGFNVKILITVRDYAIEKVKNSIGEITRYEVISLSSFTDDEIKTILRESLEIHNDSILERIVRVAEGNARMAILAGKIVKRTNTSAAIDDMSQLYSEYYGHVLRDAKLDEDKELLIALGIISFLNAIHLDKIDLLIPILEEYDLSRDTFIFALYKLHEFEIVDIYHDKAVRFSEQCLANFILKYIFYDKKILSLSSFIKACFLPYKGRVMSSINTILCVFRDENLQKFVETQIKELWGELAKEDSDTFMEFLKAFYRVNPVEALLIIERMLDEIEPAQISVDGIDTENGKNYCRIDDDILTILGGFANSTDLESALDLFFKYYLKCPDKYIQFYHACVSYFGIRKDSWNFGYYTQIKLIEKMTEYSDNWNNEYMLILFLDIAKALLELHFSPTEANRKNTGITIYYIFLSKSEGVEKYRKNIWEQLIEIVHQEKSCQSVKQILYGYGQYIDKSCHDVIASDAEYIIKLINNIFSKDVLSDCLIARHLQGVFSRANLYFDEVEELVNCNKMIIYKMLEGPSWDSDLEYEERERERKRKIFEVFKNSEDRVQEFKKLFSICKEAYSDENNKSSYDLSAGIEIAMEAVSGSKDEFLCVVSWIIDNQLTCYISPYVVVKNAFELLSFHEVYELISRILPAAEYDCWMYCFFSLIPNSSINEITYQLLLDFLKEKNDADLKNSYTRDIDFLEKYVIVDANIFIKGVRLIFEKRSYSSFAAYLYLHLLFNRYHNKPQKMMDKFSEDIPLVEEIYIWLELYGRNSDRNGEFFFEIYKQDSKFLGKYVDAVYSKTKNSEIVESLSKLRILYLLENYDEVMDSIFNQLLSLSPYPILLVPKILEKLIIKKQGQEQYGEKVDRWIRRCIKRNALNKDMMECLFESITKCSLEKRLEYIQLFLQSNSDFETFKHIPLTPRSYSWSGSAIPLYDSWIKLLSDLLPFLTGLKYLQHKKLVQLKIDYFKKEIIDEEISNIMEG